MDDGHSAGNTQWSSSGWGKAMGRCGRSGLALMIQNRAKNGAWQSAIRSKCNRHTWFALVPSKLAGLNCINAQPPLSSNLLAPASPLYPPYLSGSQKSKMPGGPAAAGDGIGANAPKVCILVFLLTAAADVSPE